MGGNLLATFGLPPKRIMPAEYDLLCSRIINVIKDKWPERRVAIPRSLTAKESHGDVDCLLEVGPHERIDWNDYFSNCPLNNNYKCHCNGGVYSIPIKIESGFVQCDFIIMGSENFDSCYNYYSYENGLLVGVLANKVGFRYGHNGLKIKIPLSEFDENLPKHDHKEILITKDIKVIFEILGFNYADFERGFDTQEQLFDWVTGSRYFNSEYFKLENLNSQNHKRNEKRPTYNAFVEYVKDKSSGEPIDRNKLRQEIKDKFPHIEVEMKEIKEELIKNSVRRQKFNGNLIKSLLNIDGPALGEFIVEFKRNIGLNSAYRSFELFLDLNTEQEITKSILDFYSKNI